MLIEVGAIQCYNEDTWNDTPFERWLAHPTRTWVEECNFRDSIILLSNFELNFSSDYRSTASFEVWDEDCSLDFQEGSIVSIRDDEYNLIFEGVIASGGNILTQKMLGPVYHQIHKITCVDWTWLGDKRVLSLAVDGALSGDIVRSIISLVLSEEGVTVGEIQDGEIVTQFRAGYCTVTEALKSLAKFAGYICFIDAQKRLYYVEPGTYVGPHDISEYVPQDVQDITKGNSSYRNREYLLGGQGTTDLIIEEQKGDGSTKTFKVSRPIATTPVIEVNSIAQTVGILNVDPAGSYDFYWNASSDTLTQDNNGTTLLPTDVFHCEYYGLYDVVNSASDFNEIASRAALDGTSGIIEQVMTGATLVTSQAAAIAICAAEVSKFAVPAEKIEFETVETIGKDLAAGNILPDAAHPDKQYLITNLKISMDGSITTYGVTACDGPADTAWEDYWTELDLAATAGTIHLGTVNNSGILILKNFTNTWSEGDYPNPFAYATVDPATMPGNSLVPGFAVADRWKYLVVYIQGVESFRKQILSVEHLSDRDIISCILESSDAVGDISAVALWGGCECSDALGSGIELDKQTYLKSKSLLESIQVSFTEIQGF